MNVTISDYTLRLFVNDHNIINNPSTIEDNSESRLACWASRERLTSVPRSSSHRPWTKTRRQRWDPVRPLSNGVLRDQVRRRRAPHLLSSPQPFQKLTCVHSLDEQPRALDVPPRLEHPQRFPHRANSDFRNDARAQHRRELQILLLCSSGPCRASRSCCECGLMSPWRRLRC
jgi:hypothetical protein